MPYSFAHPLIKGINPLSNLPVLGFEVNNFFIFDPFQSECGRFVANPLQDYGIPLEDAQKLMKLNAVISTVASYAVSVAEVAAHDDVPFIVDAIIDQLLLRYSTKTNSD